MIESNVQLNESVDKNEEDVSENVDQTVKLSIKKLQLWKKLRRTLNCGEKKYVTDTLDKTNDKVDEADVDTLEAGIGSTFGQNYTVND